MKFKVSHTTHLPDGTYFGNVSECNGYVQVTIKHTDTGDLCIFNIKTVPAPLSDNYAYVIISDGYVVDVSLNVVDNPISIDNHISYCKLPNGKYNAIWGGYALRIGDIVLATHTGIRCSGCKITVEVRDNYVYEICAGHTVDEDEDVINKDFTIVIGDSPNLLDKLMNKKLSVSLGISLDITDDGSSHYEILDKFSKANLTFSDGVLLITNLNMDMSNIQINTIDIDEA